MESYVLNALPQDENLILLSDKETKISFLRDLTLYSKTAKQEKNLLYKGIINTNTECDVIGYKSKEGYNRYIYFKSNDVDYSDNAIDKDNTYEKIGKNGIVFEENDNFVIYDKSKAKNEEINKYITLCIKLVDEEKYIYINPNYLKQMQSKNFGKEIESEE